MFYLREIIKLISKLPVIKIRSAIFKYLYSNIIAICSHSLSKIRKMLVLALFYLLWHTIITFDLRYHVQ